MAAPTMIDPTKAGQYPVILSDALLGKPSKEIYTGVRYNHRPQLSSDTAPDTARLKKSAKDESYNLGFDDQGDKYQFNGVRTSDDGNYVLIFDPVRKAFVLHRVDSTFHMNITRTPQDSSAESLSKKFPHLEIKSGSPAKKPRGKAADKARATKTAPSKAKDSGKAATKDTSKPENKKAVALTLPDLTATPASSASPSSQQQSGSGKTQSDAEKKPKRPALSPVESEEEDDDGDDILTLEIPRGNPAAFRPTGDFSQTFRPFSELVREMSVSEDDDFRNNNDSQGRGRYEEEDLEKGYEEEDEYDDDEEEDMQHQRHQTLGQPGRAENVAPAVEPDRYTFDDGDEESDAGGNDALEKDLDDLEAELEREFDKVQGGADESDVSEEE